MKDMTYQPKFIREILHEGTYKGYQFYIISYGVHPCAYIEIPSDSKLYGKHYFDIDIDVYGRFNIFRLLSQ